MADHRPGGEGESETAVSVLEARIQTAIRAAASHGRDIERIGPFTATFDPTNANPFLNYAIPDEAAEPSQNDVEALVDAYRRRRRVPRLE